MSDKESVSREKEVGERIMLIKRFLCGCASSSNSLSPKLGHDLHVILSPTVTFCVEAVGLQDPLRAALYNQDA